MKSYYLVCLVLLVCHMAFAQLENNFWDKNPASDLAWLNDTGKFIGSDAEKLQMDADVLAQYRDVVVNEWLPDPNPQVDSLPSDTNAEFIELYNRSTHPFRLKDWQLNGKSLPDTTLQPGQYLIVCRPAYVAAYQLYGPTAPMSSWPTLSNGGGQISLTNAEGVLIDIVTYESSLVTGGVAIEQINPGKTCGLLNNYSLSTASNGGTPGQRNAVFDDTPDTQGPQLLHAQVLATDTILLHFDEPIFADTPDISIAPLLAVKSWTIDQPASVLQIITHEPATSETAYTISVANISDCQGNMRGKQTLAFTMDTTPPEITRLVWVDTATLVLGFHEKIDKTATTSANYLLLPDSLSPIKVAFEPDSASVRLTFSHRLSEQPYLLQCKSITDLSGNVLESFIHAFQLEDAIDTVRVINEYQLDVAFQASLADLVAKDTKHYRLNGKVIPQAAIVHQSDSKLVHLMFDKPMAANKAHTLLVSNLQDVAGHTLQTPGYHFVYDTKAPKVKHIAALNAKHLKITMNERIAADLTKLEIAVDGTTIESARLQADGLSVLVALQDSLEQEKTYQATMSGITDIYGNELTDPQKVPFTYDTTPPTLTTWQLLSPTLLKLTFHEPLQETSATALANYALQNTAYPVSVVQAQTDPAIVFLRFDAPISDEDVLSVQHVADLQGNILQDALRTTIANRALAIGAVHAISGYQVKVTFTEEISSEQLTPTQFALSESTVANSISGLPDDLSSIVVTFDQPLQANNTLTLGADGKVIRQLLTATFAYSTKITKVVRNAPSSLSITFAVPVLLPENAMHYFSIAESHPAAVVQTDAFTFHLLFDENFQGQQVYTLKIKSFADAEYGYIPASSHTFGTGVGPQRHELLITEIMADPAPAVGLPEVEYIELYNPTDKILDLSGITFGDKQTTATFPAAVLMPKSYMLVSSRTDAALFSPDISTLGLSNFPSLNVSGDDLILENANGDLIFAIAYSDTWYNDTEKSDGGWSLEMIDTNWPCAEAENWVASTDARGGTPGAANAVQTSNPDRQSPVMHTAFALGDRTLHITFNEKFDPATLHPSYFELSEGLQVQTVELITEKEVLLTLDQEIPASTVISIQVRKVTDCAGNSIVPDQPLTFARPEKATKGDIVLSELLFNPRAGGVPFVELYNTSDKYINLQHWQLANARETTLEITKITDSPWVLAPHQYLALTTEPKVLKADYVAAPEDRLYEASIPALYVSEGTIQLLDAESHLMENFHYDERMHHPLIKNPKGVSLEKISWDTIATDANRWQSAAGSVGFATPGYQNSQTMQTLSPTLLLSAEPKIFSPYQDVQPYTTIRYHAQEAGNVATISIFNIRGKKVRTLMNQQTLAQEGWITWDGTDQALQPLPIGHYIILMQVYDLKGHTSTHRTKVVVASPF